MEAEDGEIKSYVFSYAPLLDDKPTFLGQKTTFDKGEYQEYNKVHWPPYRFVVEAITPEHAKRKANTMANKIDTYNRNLR